MKNSDQQHAPELAHMMHKLPVWIYLVWSGVILFIGTTVFFLATEVTFKEVKKLPVRILATETETTVKCFEISSQQQKYLSINQIMTLKIENIATSKKYYMPVKILYIAQTSIMVCSVKIEIPEKLRAIFLEFPPRDPNNLFSIEVPIAKTNILDGLIRKLI